MRELILYIWTNAQRGTIRNIITIWLCKTETFIFLSREAFIIIATKPLASHNPINNFFNHCVVIWVSTIVGKVLLKVSFFQSRSGDICKFTYFIIASESYRQHGPLQTLYFMFYTCWRNYRSRTMTSRLETMHSRFLPISMHHSSEEAGMQDFLLQGK